MFIKLYSVFFLVVLPALAFGDTGGKRETKDLAPKCERDGFGYVYGNQAVLRFINQNQDDFKAEAYIHGNVVESDSSSDEPRLLVKIGPNRDDTVSIIYSRFAEILPKLNVGEDIRICGRYWTHGGAGVLVNTYAEEAAYPGSGDGFVFVRGKKYQ